MTRAELFEQAKELPLAERIELLNQIRETIEDEGYDPDLTPEQLEELDRRAEEASRNPEPGIPWEQVRADLKKRYGWP